MTNRPSPPLLPEEVERVARAICWEGGQDPDRLEPGDDPYQERDGMPSPCIDGYNHKDEPCYFVWRRYDLHARAAIAAMHSDREALIEALEGCEGLESGPNGMGGMRVVAHFKAGTERPLFTVLNEALKGAKA